MRQAPRATLLLGEAEEHVVVHALGAGHEGEEEDGQLQQQAWLGLGLVRVRVRVRVRVS